MDKIWADMHRQVQQLLKKEETYPQALQTLTALRREILNEISGVLCTFPPEALYAMPYPNAAGYHNKTLAYSVWHIFRIEDIVVHELIAGDDQVLFAQGWLPPIGADRVTTGNELQGEEIVSFSKKLQPAALAAYAQAVNKSTEAVLDSLPYAQLRRKMGEAERARLLESHCVSEREEAAWLVDYWCGKDVRGLLLMPLSRHWIMHAEAMRRIKSRLCQLAGKRGGSCPLEENRRLTNGEK